MRIVDPDKRCKIGRHSKKKIYASITFVDIAGLVKGASKGEGLGNKFLSHIREVDAIIHLVRCFESDKITHVNSEINPITDLETIKTEIILSDIDVIQKKFTVYSLMTYIKLVFNVGKQKPLYFLKYCSFHLKFAANFGSHSRYISQGEFAK